MLELTLQYKCVCVDLIITLELEGTMGIMATLINHLIIKIKTSLKSHIAL